MCGILATSKKKLSVSQLEQFEAILKRRGPDQTGICAVGDGCFLFTRLAIMDLDHRAMQPFAAEAISCMCNGEIYNVAELKRQLQADRELVWDSQSDCEVLIPLYQRYGLDMFNHLDAEFALVLHDPLRGGFIAARDPLGIRPLFYGYDREFGGIVFASEAKAVLVLCDEATAFPPGHYYMEASQQFTSYRDVISSARKHGDGLPEIGKQIRSRLIKAVEKRMVADAPLGYLLSGGLDSSLVCAIAAQRSSQPIRTFAIGLDHKPIDLEYAREVAEYLGSDHQEIRFSCDDVFRVLPEVIRQLESWDITTIRAAIGMYLLCQAIHQTTDIKVLLTGEVSDELFGYKYTDYAPSPEAFQEESEKRIREIHYYDVLRADRCISAHSLEARVPFGDLAFVDYVLGIDPELKMNQNGKGKYLLRAAFEQEGLLPENILWREKEAFSDAVGHLMVDEIKQQAGRLYSDKDVLRAAQRYPHSSPRTAEALLYRNIFEQFYPGQDLLIPAYWLPNSDWQFCAVADPSARELPNYSECTLSRVSDFGLNSAVSAEPDR